MAIKKIYLVEYGDSSVGEGDSEIMIDLSDAELEELEGIEREKFREDTARFFNGYFSNGRGYKVQFDDECADCGARIKNGECSNKTCWGKPPTKEVES